MDPEVATVRPMGIGQYKRPIWPVEHLVRVHSGSTKERTVE